MQHMSAADGITRHHRHHRFGKRADFLLEIEHVEPGNAVISHVSRMAADFLVAT
jgi:hypothetical protein